MGATLREMRVGKGRGGGLGSIRIFPDPLYYQESQHKGRPVETINTKVSGKVNLIVYKLNLFPIFLVDKAKKKKTGTLSFVGS